MSTETTPQPAEDVWARLAQRKLPTLSYPLLVDDPGQATAAWQDTAAAARQIMLRHDPGSPECAAAQADVDAARAAVDACYATITLTALEPAAFEQLLDAHPPTKDQADADEAYNVDTFRPALLAVCATPRRTPGDWEQFLASRLSHGERQGLWVACLAINQSTRPVESVALPKGWTPMRN